MHRIDLPQDETLRSAQQRVQLGKTTRVRYTSLPLLPRWINLSLSPFRMTVVSVPQVGDRNVPECKKVLKRCSSGGRPISMARVETEVFVLCYDSEFELTPYPFVPPSQLIVLDENNNNNNNNNNRIRGVRRQIRSAPRRPRDHRMGRSSRPGFFPVSLRPPVLLRLCRSQALTHRTPNPNHPTRSCFWQWWWWWWKTQMFVGRTRRSRQELRLRSSRLWWGRVPRHHRYRRRVVDRVTHHARSSGPGFPSDERRMGSSV